MNKIWVSLFAASLLCACASHQWPSQAVSFDEVKPQGILSLQVKYKQEDGKPHGTTVLKVHLGANGRAKYVLLESSSGHKGIDEAATELAWNTLFKPYQRDGQHVEVTTYMPVHVNVIQAAKN